MTDWGTKCKLLNWTIVSEGLTREEAQALEHQIAERDGCLASGASNDDHDTPNAWSVYRFDYEG